VVDRQGLPVSNGLSMRQKDVSRARWGKSAFKGKRDERYFHQDEATRKPFWRCPSLGCVPGDLGSIDAKASVLSRPQERLIIVKD